MKQVIGLKHLAAALILFGLFGFCLAQAGRGTSRLAGTVVDESGNPISGAQVKLEYEKGGLKTETTTNSKGEWTFMGLGTGRITVTAVADGYLSGFIQYYLRQLEVNPVQKIVLKEDPEKRMRLKNEASLGILEKGNQLFLDRKFDEALEVYQKFAAENPEIYQIHFNIGDCFRENKNWAKAIEQYNLALEKATAKNDMASKAKAFASIGEVYLLQNDFKQAQEQFKKSIDLNPQDEILAYNVAEICFANNKTDEALQYYQLAIQIKPTWGDPFVKLGYVYLNKGDMAKAKESFAKYLEVSPEGAKAAEVKTILESLKNIK